MTLEYAERCETITVPWEATAEQLAFIGALVEQYRRAALLERDAAWLAVVKEIEWAGNLGQNSYGCPVCQGFEEAGHQPDCALRALLEEAGSQGRRT